MYFFIFILMSMVTFSVAGMREQKKYELFDAIYEYGTIQQLHTKKIKRLLDEKSDPNCVYRGGAVPLDWAIGFDKECHQPVIKMLLESKADFNRKAKLKPCLTIFEYFLLEQNGTFSQEGITLFLTHKADPCKMIPLCNCPGSHEYQQRQEETLAYEHVFHIKDMRTTMLNAIPERLFFGPYKEWVKIFLLCMKTIKKPSSKDTKLTLNPCHVPPKGVQYLILKIAPFIEAKKAIAEVAQKDIISKSEAQKLKNALLCAIQAYQKNDSSHQLK